MASAPIFCREKQRLCDEFLNAVSEYLKIESAILAAAMRDDEFQFDRELEAARTRKNAVKESIKKHQQEHGC